MPATRTRRHAATSRARPASARPTTGWVASIRRAPPEVRTNRKPTSSSGTAATPTRAERRHQLEARRTRTLVIGALVLSIVVLVAWFPASALLSDRRALATVTTQLDTLRRQDRALTQESARLSQPAEIERVARQQYQMVPPGAQEYQVLPKSNSAGGAYATDPGLQRPVAPSGSAQLPPGTLTDGAGGPGATSGSPTGPSGAAAGGSSGGGLLARILRTLEFWR